MSCKTVWKDIGEPPYGTPSPVIVHGDPCTCPRYESDGKAHRDMFVFMISTMLGAPLILFGILLILSYIRGG